MKKTHSSISAALGLAVLLGGPAYSRDGAAALQDAKQALQVEVSVSLKLVQVYVVDRKGKAVTDLALSDFEIYDNGKLMPLTEFEKHVAPLPAKPGEVPAEAAAAPAPRVNRKFFLLFDFGFNDQKGIVKAKAAGLHFLDSQVRPRDEVAVLSTSTSRGMAVHEYLTSDHDKARRAVESLGVGGISGRASEIELLMDREQQLARAQDIGKTAGAEISEVEQAEKDQIKGVGQFAQGTYSQQVQQYLKNFKDMAKALRYVQGNKSLVLFSGGVARSLVFGSMENLSKMPDDPYKSIDGIAEYSKLLENLHGDSGIQEEFKNLLLELKVSNTSVYAVNETATQSGSADPATRDLRGDEFLRQLSNMTGGRYFHTTQDPLKAMESIQEITGSYYVLGYKVEEKWDGKYHELKINVKRPGCRTWGVGGYFNPKPFTEFNDLEKRLQLIDLALNENPQAQTPAFISLKALPAFKGPDPWLAVLAPLLEDQKKGLFGPKTEAVVFLFDEQKNLKGLKRTELNLRGEGTGNSCLTAALPIQTGRFICTVVVRNLETGRSARGSSDVNVPAKITASLKFSSPLWLVAQPGDRWHELSAKESLFSLYSFKRNDYAPVADEIGLGTAKLYGVFPLSFSGLNSPEILLSAQLVEQASGMRKTLPPAVLERARDGNSVTYFFEVALGELTRGAQTLYFFAKEQLGDSRVFITNLTVR